MSYTMFKAYWTILSPKKAQQFAKEKGVSQTTVDLWTFRCRVEVV